MHQKKKESLRALKTDLLTGSRHPPTYGNAPRPGPTLFQHKT